MALQGITTFIPTMTLFTAHWVNVNAALAEPMVLRDGSTLLSLTTLKAELDGALTEVENRLNDKEIARAEVELKKAALLDRAQEFGRKLRGKLLPGAPFLSAIPEMPLQSSAEGKFVKPMRDIVTLWAKVDDAEPILLLSGSYNLATFELELEALKTAYDILNTAIQDLSLSHKERNKMMAFARSMLGGYRLAVEGEFPPDSPLVESIPRLSPLPGHTPEPVILTATYDAVENQSVLTFTQSQDPTLREYELRAVPGPEYDAQDEHVIANILPSAPREIRTAYSLDNPGMAASFRLYTILETDNEAASNTQTITRPA